MIGPDKICLCVVTREMCLIGEIQVEWRMSHAGKPITQGDTEHHETRKRECLNPFAKFNLRKTLHAVSKHRRPAQPRKKPIPPAKAYFGILASIRGEKFLNGLLSNRHEI